MVKKKVTVIGGGIAGMEAAGRLISMGFEVVLLEKSSSLGGHVAQWHNLFPDKKPALDIIENIKLSVINKADIHLDVDVNKVSRQNGNFTVYTNNGKNIESDAIIVATGYDLFDASKKEEYGYKIYDNVITSADLEEKFKNGELIKTKNGDIPKRIAFIHCVGSRDEKVGNTYCSKVCCVTGVKQAMEIKLSIPEVEVYSFYMDLRMYDRYFEDLYYEAQANYGIRFIRGRLSEACENQDGSIMLKAEDTLIGKPLKMNVDLVVLLVGMVSPCNVAHLKRKFLVDASSDNFIKPLDNHINLNLTLVEGIFVAGTCTGPKSVAETLSDARSAAIQAACFLNGNCN